MWREKHVKRVVALIVILILAVVLFSGLLPYINAFFGAFILFILFRPLYQWFHHRLHLYRSFSALIVIIVSILVVIIPAYFIIDATIKEVSTVLMDKTILQQSFSGVDQLFPNIDIRDYVVGNVPKISSIISSQLVGIIQNITRLGISLTITYFLLYFLLITTQRNFLKHSYKVIPFSRKNARRLLQEFKTVTYSTVFTSGLMAVLQGFLLAIGFLIFDVQAAVFWGLIGAFLAFLPVVGPAIIWVPVAGIAFIQQNYTVAIGIAVLGVFIANVDNFLRPLVQKRVGRIHPLVSLLGIFIGISLFGVLGIVVGPMLLSFFLLMLEMFNQEYIAKNGKKKAVPGKPYEDA
ncbi:MAG: AI-2E family transporter [Candidatus Woesearchaeota archaeon]